MSQLLQNSSPGLHNHRFIPFFFFFIINSYVWCLTCLKENHHVTCKWARLPLTPGKSQIDFQQWLSPHKPSQPGTCVSIDPSWYPCSWPYPWVREQTSAVDSIPLQHLWGTDREHSYGTKGWENSLNKNNESLGS